MKRYQKPRNRENVSFKNSTKLSLQSDSKNKTQTRTKLKRILEVYKKDNKFYIDHSAAHALNLTSVRSIMMDKPHLVEVGLEFLLQMQNRGDVDVEYKELNMEKEVDSINKNESLTDTLESLENGKYGIGVHGIDKGSSEERYSKASNINEEGLHINNNSRTILSTAISLGTNEGTVQISENITKYKFGNGSKYSVVIAVPLCIQNKNGEKIFLGFPEKNERTSGQQYTEHCILDRICRNLGEIPSEFILGYNYENPDGTESFIRNQKHYSTLPNESKEEVYNKIFRNMDNFSKRINELISSGDINRLNQLRQQMEERSLDTNIIDNAIQLSKKQETKETEVNLNKKDSIEERY